MHDTIGSTDERSPNGRVPAKHCATCSRRATPMSAAAPAGACAFVLNRADGTVTIVRTSTKRVLPPIAVGRRAVGRGGDARRTARLREQRSCQYRERARRGAPHDRGDHRRRPRAARTRGDTGWPPRLRRQHRRRFDQRDRHHHQHRHRRSHRRGADAVDARDRAGWTQGLRRERLGEQRHGDRSHDARACRDHRRWARCRWRSPSRRTAGSRSSPTPARIR